MACPNCGSWAVKADRSLAGRMVCARCGQLLGVGAGQRQGRRFAWPLPRLPLPRQWRGWLSLGLLLAVSALLAAQVPNERQPPPDPGSPLTRRPGVVPIP
jgi:hypothetical protein